MVCGCKQICYQLSLEAILWARISVNNALLDRYDYSASQFFWYTLFMLLSLAYYSFYGIMVRVILNQLLQQPDLNYFCK